MIGYVRYFQEPRGIQLEDWVRGVGSIEAVFKLNGLLNNQFTNHKRICGNTRVQRNDWDMIQVNVVANRKTTRLHKATSFFTRPFAPTN